MTGCEGSKRMTMIEESTIPFAHIISFISMILVWFGSGPPHSIVQRLCNVESRSASGPTHYTMTVTNAIDCRREGLGADHRAPMITYFNGIPQSGSGLAHSN